MAGSLRLHASCVAIKGRGVLLVGPSGAGKSDLALRLIDEGAALVSDDQTEVSLDGERLIAAPPASLVGLLEVRQIGLMRLPYTAPVPIALYVDLTAFDLPEERLPEPAFYSLLDHPIKRLKLMGLAASTPAKIRAALQGTFQDV